ncbi:hypothetical protein CUU80_00815 [Bifidobacterium scaligerum]|uniref:AB hydrolase-1 domain-containing protein n=2 Tax=Bifidobacterium scaligerum TaxID=2052656 RepID=A0A2M9HSF0_9BIFI|nr:hypothetical protein CUU80_00815 [Bifidobacterium scaligerum]
MSTPQQPQQPPYPPFDSQQHSPDEQRYGQSSAPYPAPPYYGQPSGSEPHIAPAPLTPPRKKMPTWLVILITVIVAIALNIGILVGIGRGVAALVQTAGNSRHDGYGPHARRSNPQPSARPDSVSAAFDSYYTQQYTWTSCDQGDACTTVKAPSNWSDPSSETIKLHLAVHYAEGDDSKGYLFINPGGPGASGADWLKDFIEYTATDDLREDYDIIGFDPRGVADSAPISCGDDSQLLNRYFLADPITSDNLDSSRKLANTFANSCREHSGTIIDHVDTQSVAHDLDLMRALMGEDQLDYLGFSYGTYIGSTYDAMFPKQTGRLVLDGAIDPQEDATTSIVEQAVGFENALTTYLDDCIDNDDSCPFTGMKTSDATAIIQSWLARADTDPWPPPQAKR